MNQSISTEIKKLEKQKSSVLEFLRKQDEKELKKALPGKWSMIQAMRHVQMSESGSVGYMMKKSQAGDQMQKRPLLPKLYLLALYLVFFLRIKFKAPSIIANPTITTLAELEDDWENTRGKLKIFVEKYPDKWEDKAVYRHPFLGMLNITDALRFLNAHLAHHRNQLKRIERQIKRLDVFDNKGTMSR